MRSSTSILRGAIVLSFVSFSYVCFGQLSLMAEASGVSLHNGDGEYNIDSHWPGDNVPTGAPIAYLRDATGSAWSINAMYDLNPKWSIGIGFTSAQFSASATKRHVNSSVLGVRLKYNFVPNTKSFVPYLQVGYNFFNANNFSQDQLFNSFGQRQEQFSTSTNTNVGVSFTLGAEIRLSNPFRLTLSSSLNKINLTADDNILSTAFYNNASRTSTDPVNTKPPTAVNGVGFWSYSAGLKYYLGRAKKKRNF